MLKFLVILLSILFVVTTKADQGLIDLANTALSKARDTDAQQLSTEDIPEFRTLVDRTFVAVLNTLTGSQLCRNLSHFRDFVNHFGISARVARQAARRCQGKEVNGHLPVLAPRSHPPRSRDFKLVKLEAENRLLDAWSTNRTESQTFLFITPSTQAIDLVTFIVHEFLVIGDTKSTLTCGMLAYVADPESATYRHAYTELELCTNLTLIDLPYFRSAFYLMRVHRTEMRVLAELFERPPVYLNPGAQPWDGLFDWFDLQELPEHDQSCTNEFSGWLEFTSALPPLVLLSLFEDVAYFAAKEGARAANEMMTLSGLGVKFNSYDTTKKLTDPEFVRRIFDSSQISHILPPEMSICELLAEPHLSVPLHHTESGPRSHLPGGWYLPPDTDGFESGGEIQVDHGEIIVNPPIQIYPGELPGEPLIHPPLIEPNPEPKWNLPWISPDR